MNAALHSRDFRLPVMSLLLFIGTLVLFSRSLGDGFLDCDDPDYVVQNMHVQGGFTWANICWAFTSGEAANWHPLTWLSHMLDWKLFKSDPRGHHAINILLHAGNAVLALLVLRRLTGAFWLSAFMAALFAWHPLRVESVAWIAERKDVLSAFFGLAAILAYATYASRKLQNQSGRNIFYWLSWLAFVAGLMCKPMLVTLPFLLLLLDWWPLGGFKVWGSVMEKIPFFLMSAASCVITYGVQKSGGAIVGNLNWGQRLADAVVALAGYLANFFWPFGLAVGYPRPGHWPPMEIAAAAALVSGITFVAVTQRHARPWIFVGWFWFCGMLVPVLGLVPVGLQNMADRYTYLPVLGWQLALVAMLRETTWISAGRRWLATGAALWLAGCGLRTWDQQGVWKDSETLYEHALKVDDKNYSAHCFLGVTLYNQNRLAGAEWHFRRALELKPDFASALYRLGLVLEKRGRFSAALAAYDQLLKIRPEDAKTWFEAGVVWEDSGCESAALTNYLEAARWDPGFSTAHYNAGVIFLNQDQPQAALASFQKAAQGRPDYPAAYVGMGLADEKIGRAAESARCLKMAYRLDPAFPGLAGLIAPRPPEPAGDPPE